MIPGISVDGRPEEGLMRSANTIKTGKVKDDAVVGSRYLMSARSPEVL